MKKLLFACLTGLLFILPILGQVDGGNGGGSASTDDTPFSDRSFHTYGRATVHASDGIGEDPGEVESHKPSGNKYDCVHMAQSDPFGDPGEDGAIARSFGSMSVNHSPVGLICASEASGKCENGSVEESSFAKYNVRAHSRLSASNAHLTDSASVKIIFTGFRAPHTLVEREDSEIVNGLLRVQITGVDGKVRDYKCDVVQTGWKLAGEKPIESTTLNKEFADSIAPGESIEVRCVAEAFHNVGSVGFFGHQVAESKIQMKVKVLLVGESEETSAP